MVRKKKTVSSCDDMSLYMENPKAVSGKLLGK